MVETKAKKVRKIKLDAKVLPEEKEIFKRKCAELDQTPSGLINIFVRMFNRDKIDFPFIH